MPDAIENAALLRHTADELARLLPVAIASARDDVLAIVADILAIPEDALERDWPWIGGGEEAVRYGPYRVAEIFERAQVDAARALAAAGRDGGLAAALIGPSSTARWDLHGLLAPLSEHELDADPGDGEWSIRRTLGHIVLSQRAYGWSTAWWQEQGYRPDDHDLPPTVPDDVWTDLPAEDGPEQEGSLAEIQARLDAVLDLSTERLAGMADEHLGQGARWSGFAVPIAFRLGRWSSHIREHTVQVEKTLALLGRVPTEPERLVRVALAAYGRAEAVVFGRRDPDAAAEIVRDAAAEARTTIADARRSAEA
jgi:hypothetical protein